MSSRRGLLARFGRGLCNVFAFCEYPLPYLFTHIFIPYVHQCTVENPT